jgi:hypothetical protein
MITLSLSKGDNGAKRALTMIGMSCAHLSHQRSNSWKKTLTCV